MKLLIFAAVVCAASALPQFQQYRPQYQPQIQQQYQPQTQQQYQYYQDQRPRAALERNAAILRSDSEVNEQGYRFAYETENGIQAEEVGREADGIQAQGGYAYVGDDGQTYNVRYTADANGFQAQGAHIPTPPPIPAEIARALEENARDEANGIFDDGSYHEGKYDDSGVVAARNPYNYPFRQVTGAPYRTYQ